MTSAAACASSAASSPSGMIDFPVARSEAATAVLNGKVYLMGGAGVGFWKVDDESEQGLGLILGVLAIRHAQRHPTGQSR